MKIVRVNLAPTISSKQFSINFRFELRKVGDIGLQVAMGLSGGTFELINERFDKLSIRNEKLPISTGLSVWWKRFN